MKEVVFDFDRIATVADFYTVAKKQLNFPEHFGNNLDALWDELTGDIVLPVAVKFTHLSLNQLETFDKVIAVFEDASEALDDNFNFEYYLKKYE